MSLGIPARLRVFTTTSIPPISSSTLMEAGASTKIHKMVSIRHEAKVVFGLMVEGIERVLVVFANGDEYKCFDIARRSINN